MRLSRKIRLFVAVMATSCFCLSAIALTIEEFEAQRDAERKEFDEQKATGLKAFNKARSAAQSADPAKIAPPEKMIDISQKEQCGDDESGCEHGVFWHCAWSTKLYSLLESDNKKCASTKDDTPVIGVSHPQEPECSDDDYECGSSGIIAISSTVAYAKTTSYSVTPGTELQQPLKNGGKAPKMVIISGGSFDKGCANNHSFDCPNNERFERGDTIAHPFALGQTEVTVADFKQFALLGNYRGYLGEFWLKDNKAKDDKSAANVSWSEADLYAKWLSEQTGSRYRLPSEVEWEYAAKAGAKTRYSWGDYLDCSQVRFQPGTGFCKAQYQWEDAKKSGKQSQYGKIKANPNCWIGGYQKKKSDAGECKAPLTDSQLVATYPPNGFGLYDMLDNVSEWVSDCYDFYSESDYDDEDELRPNARMYRHCRYRGGSWRDEGASWGVSKRRYSTKKYLVEPYRPSYRPSEGASPGFDSNFVFGFRLVMELEPPEITPAMHKGLLQSARKASGSSERTGIEKMSLYYNWANTTAATVVFAGSVGDTPYSIDKQHTECFVRPRNQWQCRATNKHYITIKAQAEPIEVVPNWNEGKTLSSLQAKKVAELVLQSSHKKKYTSDFNNRGACSHRIIHQILPSDDEYGEGYSVTMGDCTWPLGQDNDNNFYVMSLMHGE